jgi:hypothetical protein
MSSRLAVARAQGLVNVALGAIPSILNGKINPALRVAYTEPLAMILRRVAVTGFEAGYAAGAYRARQQAYARGGKPRPMPKRRKK